MRTRAALRPLLSGLLVLVLLAGTGVTAAVLLRPDLDSSPQAERAAATGLGERAVSLEGLRRPPSPGDDEAAPTGPPPKTPEVIGVGTGEFSGAADAAAIEDVDGPADPRGGRDRLRRRDPQRARRVPQPPRRDRSAKGSAGLRR